MTEWVTIKPGTKRVPQADGTVQEQPHRVPMPQRYGVKHGSALPAEGMRVPRDSFVQRLLQDGDAVLLTKTAGAATAGTVTSATTSATSTTVSSGGTASSGSQT